MIYIYSETFRPWAKLKRVIKRVLRRGLGGPKAVEQSLLRGLTKLNQDFVWNRKPIQKGQVACVLSGKETLRWAIRQKQKGTFDRLVAGPNIAVTPLDDNGLILNSAIDAYVVPAQWSIDWWTSLAPAMTAKLKIWPAGVEDKGQSAHPSGQILVFQKNAPDSLLKMVMEELKNRSEQFKIIRYGHYTKKEYLSFLAQSKLMVYLSQSESQGLALHEAWMAGVPTLVWDRGYMTYGVYRWEGQKLSAPYLDEQCGMFFSSQEDFGEKLTQFLSKLSNFDPRAYSQKNFTDSESAKIFLNIIQSL